MQFFPKLNESYEFAIRNVMAPSVVIASEAKQSRFGGERDCFVVSLLAMTADIDVMKIIANRYHLPFEALSLT